MVSPLILVCYVYSLGCITPMLRMEQNIPGFWHILLLQDPMTSKVHDDAVRKVQAAISEIAKSKVPQMTGISAVIGAVLSVIQMIQSDYAPKEMRVAVVAVLFILYALTKVGEAVKAAETTDPKGPIAVVRTSLRSEAIFHHTGMVFFALISTLQAIVLSSSSN